MNIIRRTMLAQLGAIAAILIALPACTPAQRDAALEKLKDISQGFTDAVKEYGALLFPAEVTQIEKNNTAIQALTAGDWIGAARVLVGAIMRTATRILPLIPFGGAADAVATVVAFLSNFAGIVAAGAGVDDKGGTIRRLSIPTEDEAHSAALTLRRR